MNENLHVSDAGLAMIKKFEGFSTKKYRDASGYSIGYGHFLTPADKSSGKYEHRINREDAENLLRQDVQKAENAIKQYIKVPLTQNQFDALVSMLYNTGPKPIISGGLGKLINSGKFDAVPEEMKKWRKSEGVINSALVSRRDNEAALFQGTPSFVQSPVNHKSENNKDPLHQYLERIMGKGYDPYKALSQTPANDIKPGLTQTKTVAQLPTQVNDILSRYLKSVAASEKQNKKLYKKYLPINNVVISISSADYTDSIEFGRILCSALNEELLTKSFIHTDENNIEVECSIHGPSKECFHAIKQLTLAVSDAFKNATKKIGSINIETNFSMNKKSSYQQINLKTAETQYRMFLLKFI